MQEAQLRDDLVQMVEYDDSIQQTPTDGGYLFKSFYFF